MLFFSLVLLSFYSTIFAIFVSVTTFIVATTAIIIVMRKRGAKMKVIILYILLDGAD
jgi:hypothetical protein